MKEFYIVGRWDTNYRGEQDLNAYHYNGAVVIKNRKSAEMTVELCNDQWPSNEYQSEWRLFKIVEAE